MFKLHNVSSKLAKRLIFSMILGIPIFFFLQTSKCFAGMMPPSTYSWNAQNIPQQHSRRIATPPLVSLGNGIWGSSAKIPYWWRVTSLILILLWLVVPWGQLATTNQKRYLDLGSFASSVWNFFVCSTDVILARNQWLRREIWTVF